MNGSDCQSANGKCAWPGCDAPGPYHRAPKDRSLTEYVYYCLDHVRDYNASWNFHAGLGDAAIESELRSAATWDRPTWKLGALGRRPGAWRDLRVDDPFGAADGTDFDPRSRQRARGDGWSMATGFKSEHRNAMKVLELDAPFTLDELKARYKALVKVHHPDAAGQSASAEDRMKSINAAYHLLKRSLADAARPRARP